MRIYTAEHTPPTAGVLFVFVATKTTPPRDKNFSLFATTPTWLSFAEPSALSARHPQRPRPRLNQENGHWQAPQIVMLVITKKTQNPTPPPPPVRALQGSTLNIRGMTPAKWLSIQGLSIFSSLEYIILTEH